MCGRTAQTLAAVQAAAGSLEATVRTLLTTDANALAATDDGLNPITAAATPSTTGRTGASCSGTFAIVPKRSEGDSEDVVSSSRNNFNMSPGMDAFVFWKDNKEVDKHGGLRCDKKVWGLVSRGGSQAAPIPEGMGKHFSNLMFNARYRHFS
jgi:hypothetical protein